MQAPLTLNKKIFAHMYVCMHVCRHAWALVIFNYDFDFQLLWKQDYRWNPYCTALQREQYVSLTEFKMGAPVQTHTGGERVVSAPTSPDLKLTWVARLSRAPHYIWDQRSCSILTTSSDDESRTVSWSAHVVFSTYSLFSSDASSRGISHDIPPGSQTPPCFRTQVESSIISVDPVCLQQPCVCVPICFISGNRGFSENSES